jgi:hypothetical protein
MTAVEWLAEQFETIVFYSEEAKEDTISKAKEIEKIKIVEAKIELIKSIGNQGKNAPLYGILKTTLIELQQQHNEIIARCLN